VSDEARELALLRNQVDYLKRVVAYEARVIEAQTMDLKSLSKSRRRVLEASIVAMRRVAIDEPTDRYSDVGAYRELENLKEGYR
jgi:hypothetical protein